MKQKLKVQQIIPFLNAHDSIYMKLLYSSKEPSGSEFADLCPQAGGVVLCHQDPSASLNLFLSSSLSPSLPSFNIVELNTTNQLDLMDVYKLMHWNPAEYTIFSSSYGTVPKIDLILGHKTYLKLKRIEIIQCRLSDLLVSSSHEHVLE